MQHKCNLIIDSCCDLPFEVVDREGVELIRFPYIMSDGEHADDLYQTSSAHDFYQAMRNGEEPTTAQVPVPVFRDAFERAIASGVPTVYLSFSSGLSGSFDAAALVHDQLMAEHPDAELYIVDTCLASVAEALLVYEALRQRDNGMTAQEISAVEADALYRAVRRSSASLDQATERVGAATPVAEQVLAAVNTGRFDGTYTVEMFMAELSAALTAADDVDLILPQAEACLHLLELLAVIGGSDKAPAALALVYGEEKTCAEQGLDWTRAEQAYGDVAEGFDDLDDDGHDHGHDHGSFGDYPGYGAYSAN